MNIITSIRRTGLALAAITTFSLAACGSSGGFSALPGDYEGAAVALLDGETPAFLYLSVTVAEDGSVTGTGKVYDAGASMVGSIDAARVPSSANTFTVTGQASGDGVELDFEDGVTGTGTVQDSGLVRFTFGGEIEDGEIDGYGVLAPALDGETAIACGEFGFGNETAETGGIVMLVGSDGGDYFGAFLSAMGDDFVGFVTGEFEAGAMNCGDVTDTCNGGVVGTVTGTLDGEPVELEIDSSGDAYFQENESYEVFGIYEVSMDSDDFEGGLIADTYYCEGGDYD